MLFAAWRNFCWKSNDNLGQRSCGSTSRESRPSLLSFYSVLAGDTERALELAERTRKLNPTPPDWIYTTFGIAYYLRGEYEKALLALSNWGPSKDIQVEFFKAASLGMLGRDDEARQVWDGLVAMDAGFAENPRREINRLVVNTETINALVDGLARAGLYIESQEEEKLKKD